jgi:hypothetical protein
LGYRFRAIQQAREQLERSLGIDGNAVFALFTSLKAGLVPIRRVPWDKVTSVAGAERS